MPGVPFRLRAAEQSKGCGWWTTEAAQVRFPSGYTKEKFVKPKRPVGEEWVPTNGKSFPKMLVLILQFLDGVLEMVDEVNRLLKNC